MVFVFGYKHLVDVILSSVSLF